MPDDAPAASDRAPQQPLTFDEWWEGKGYSAAMQRHGDEYAHAKQVAHLAWDACRAAGAAAPPQQRGSKPLYNAIMALEPDMNRGLPNNEPDAYRAGYDDARHDAARKVRDSDSGAGAATPALTAEDRAHVERVRAKCNSGQPVNATLLLLGVIDRLDAAGGVAAAPSPAATPSAQVKQT